jgi:hypothetical protein
MPFACPDELPLITESPIFQSRYKSGANRIQMNVAGDLEQIFILENQLAFCTRFE